ncbi:Gfo/Idh/MocA family protein [Arthrobacter cupressi]|uniref:Predicted dehydrogenase n=1 Tax=Arthrobacter cupressi TaxID=1045773 RepID=A0A1G8NZ93_9MICC|nr:Gfo/Idh/MocA family oxidoreductase [Arthrobacter cupressi]NYD76678.1 putative dehydrogenase [Arthrobacter cupressi]SDI85621.1 Predicted dehydrogenase [Arthrobacter cupressi]
MTFTSYFDASSAAGSLALPRLEAAGTGKTTALVRGTGSIGARHLRVLKQLGVEKLYAWPVRPGASLADRPDLPASAELVDDWPDAPLDLVVIATDTRRHVEDTLEALGRAPGAVLLEKPVAPAAADARILLEHARAETISVSAPLRFHQGFAVAAELLPRLGRITSAQVVSQSWLPSWRPNRDFRASYSARKEDGGVLRDLVHDIDYPTMLLGAPTELRSVLGSGILGIEAEESADILWDSPAAVHLRLDYVTPVKTRSIRIATDEGALVWDVVRNRVALEWPDTETASVGSVEAFFGDDADVDTILARQSLSILQRTGIDGGTTMERFRPASLEEGVASVAICDAARTSSASGGTEKVVW